jgi:enoyl-CoA hydratase/carnithine racemase
MTDSHNVVVCERRGKIAWIRLNRPKSLNALTIQMIDAFEKSLAELGSVENQDSPWRLGVIQAFDG